MKKSVLTLTLAIFFGSFVFAGTLENNKSSSLKVFEKSQSKAAEKKSGGDWNPETGYIIRIDQMSAEYLNLVVETSECGSPASKEKLDKFFNDRLLTETIVTLLNDATKQCLNGYLNSK